MLAKELLGSKVEINLDISVYDIASLDRKFDIILFFGVYYHLLDPFYALAQIRHCCHSDTVVLVHGAEAATLSPATALYDLSNHACEWMAHARGINTWRLRLIWQVLKASHTGVREMVRQFEPGARQMLMKCIPAEDEGKANYYRPPVRASQVRYSVP